MKKKHGLWWWLFIGWWWYLGIAWWLYPILYFVRRKREAPVPAVDVPDPRKREEVILAVLDAIQRSGGSVLQVDVKASLPSWMSDYFDDTVRELYETGRIKTSKDGARVRLELV